jgi:hypothetical protein
MPYKPLMLSDTAMVLLREYACIDEDGRAMLADPLVDDDLLKAPVEWDNFSPLLDYGSRLRSMLMYEIWLLWTYSDIELIRHIDWHLVLDDHLMSLAQKTFFSTRSYRISDRTIHPHYHGLFAEELLKAYKNALETRLNTKALSKDEEV